MTNREIAEKIAERLFTNGSKKKADRLELKQGPEPGIEISLGGWGFKPAIDQIEKVLNEVKK